MTDGRALAAAAAASTTHLLLQLQLTGCCHQLDTHHNI
jgi:hypothetical protein